MEIMTIVALCLVILLAGGVAVNIYVGSKILKQQRNAEKGISSESRKLKKGVGTMNLILILIGVFLLAFTVYMIVLFKEYGMIPDTLVTCVFASLAGECGIMGWIKTSKERKRERKWEIEDRKDMEE
jgi:flagellar basal body-associated protein FliL